MQWNGNMMRKFWKETRGRLYGLWSSKKRNGNFKIENHVTLTEAKRHFNFRVSNSYLAKVKQQVEKESVDCNLHKLAIFIEEKSQQIMDIVLHLCELMSNSQQKTDALKANKIEENVTEAPGQN